MGGAIRGSIGNVAAGAVVLGSIGWGAQRVVGRWWDRRIALDSSGASEESASNPANKVATVTSDHGDVVQRMSKSRFNPMRRLSDEEYAGMLKEKLLKVEAELALVDDDITKLVSEKQRNVTAQE